MKTLRLIFEWLMMILAIFVALILIGFAVMLIMHDLGE